MTLILDGSNGLSDIDGSAATPAIRGTDTNTGIFFPAADTIAFSEGGAEVARFDSSGNLGIGTASPLAKLQVNGAIRTTYDSSYYGTFNNATGAVQVYANGDSAPLLFGTTSAGGSTATERMRINSDGFSIFGSSGTLTPNANKVIIYPSASVESGRVAVVGNNNAGGALFQGLRSDTQASTVLIRPNGNLENANNSYGALSDIKLKENIVDATPKLDDLMKVKVRNYNLIGDTNKQIGVVAQELEEVFAGLVEETKDTDKDSNDLGTTTKSVKYSVFIPMLVKAIQELNAKVDAQAATIAELQAKAT
jgi:hypothetical protein